MAAGRGRESRGRARSRRDEDAEDESDEQPRGGYQRGASGPNMPLIIGSVVGLVALLVIGGLAINSTAKSRAADARRKQEDAERDKRKREEKLAAAEAEMKQHAADKSARTGPWSKALEKVVMPLKRYMEKENKVKRIILSRGWENDRAEFHVKIRPKFYTEPFDDVKDTLQELCDKIVECAENGFAHAEKEGYPMKEDSKVIIIHFWDAPVEEQPKEGDGEADEDDPFAQASGKKKDKGKEVATYRNGSLTITGRK